MRLHPRRKRVAQARGEMALAIVEIEDRNGLTFGETVSILSALLAERAKYEIRAERHPGDPDKKGDEA